MAAKQIDDLRNEVAGFIDLAFDTISAYGGNAAIVHYAPDAENDTIIKKEGLFLIDSGGQYYGGTTDVTRTIVMGALTEGMRRDFTAVARGMLNLGNLIFLHGCTGRNLDIIARKPVWEAGGDYKHGTGHGIGYMLNVHEGPQGIWMPYHADRTEAVLEPGMLISNEPGIYKAGEYGIRIENILLVKEITQNDNGRFLGFEPLTLVPIDLAGIDPAQLTAEDKRQLNEYHLKVYEEMSPYLTADVKEWLKNATRAI
jgi:Xaa-Pro aminopeptidase